MLGRIVTDSLLLLGNIARREMDELKQLDSINMWERIMKQKKNTDQPPHNCFFFLFSRLDTYAQADGILYCKKHYGQKVVAKNTQPTC